MSIQFNTSTPNLHDLLAPAGFDHRGAVAFENGCARVCCLPLEGIMTEQGQDNILEPLDCLKGRKGVYAVVEGDTALYVGSSTKVTKKWNLGKRIAQHFRNDGGGNLWKNWQRAHPDCDFTQFLSGMRCCHLQVISFGRDACDQHVLRLEHLLIGLHGPRYCDVPK